MQTILKATIAAAAAMALPSCSGEKAETPVDKRTASLPATQAATGPFSGSHAWKAYRYEMGPEVDVVLVSAGSGPNGMILVPSADGGYAVAHGEIRCDIRAVSMRKARGSDTDGGEPMREMSPPELRLTRVVEAHCADKPIATVEGTVQQAVAAGRKAAADAVAAPRATTPSGAARTPQGT